MNATKIMIMTMTATTTMTKNMTATMTKNTTTTATKNTALYMATIFKKIQKDNFYCLLKMIKKVDKR